MLSKHKAAIHPVPTEDEAPKVKAILVEEEKIQQNILHLQEKQAQMLQEMWTLGK